MAEVKAFAGLRFGSLPLADVIAPPYDVISPDEQDQLYARSPYNVVRLELGREPDRYAEARRCFQEWRQAGVLRQDEPSLYVYEQRFYGGKVRRGLFGRVKLEPWSAGVILPHEETLTKPKTDRLELLRAVKANVSPVFALYEDPEKELAAMLASVSRRPPTSEAKDEAGEDHRLWQVSEGELVSRISAFFAGQQLFIADGHHRYETALAYRDEQPPSPTAFAVRVGPGEGRGEGACSSTDHPHRTQPFGYVLAALVDFADPGLAVLPTHRLVAGLSNATLRQLGDRLGQYFEVVAAAEESGPKAVDAALRQLATIEGPAYVLCGPKPGGLRVLALKPGRRSATFDESHSPAWNQLDVAVLHSVLGRILGLQAEDLASERYFSYTRDATFAVREVQRDEAQMALLLRPTPATAIRDVALARDKMPQKSTYFYPKLATGLVINPLQ
jgi:uncharacterized protein (DUF1015 family)